MPDNNKKLDFVKAVNNGNSFYDLRSSGYDVVMPSKENMIKNGFDQQYVDQNYDRLLNEYSKYSAGEYISQFNQQANLANLFQDNIFVNSWRGPGRNIPLGYSSMPYKYGYDIEGKMSATPTQVAFNRGYYYDKNGQRQEIGNYFQRIGQLFNSNITTAVLDDTGNYVFKTIPGFMSGDEVMQARSHEYTWAKNNPIKLNESEWLDIDYINGVNMSLLETGNMEIMGLRPQKMDRTWMGALLNGLGTQIVTEIPKIGAMLRAEIADLQACFDASKYDVAQDVATNVSRMQKRFNGKRDYDAMQQSAWSGKNLFYLGGDVAGQLIAQAGANYLLPGSGYALSAGVLMAETQEAMIDLGIPPEDRAWITPVVGTISFLIERSGSNIVSNMFSNKKVASEVTNEFIKDATKNIAKQTAKETGIKSFATATGSQKLAFAKSFKDNLTGFFRYNTVKGAWEEGREEIIEQFANDLLFNTYDSVARNQGKNTFNDWDEQRNWVGNFTKDINFMDDYLLSFLGGAIGGTVGGLFLDIKNKFHRDNGIDRIADMIVNGKGQEVIDFANSKAGEKLFGGWYTDGKKILNQAEIDAGAITLGQQAKENYVAQVQMMMDVYEKYGIKNAKALKTFGDDLSLATDAIKIASGIEYLNQQKQTIIDSMSTLDEKQKTQAEENIKKIDILIAKNNEILKYLIEPENTTFSKAYNDKAKEAAAIFKMAEYLAEKGIKNIESQSKKELTEEEKKLRVASIANNIYGNIKKDISKSPVKTYKSILSNFAKATQEYNEFAKKLNSDITNASMSLSNNITAISTDIDGYLQMVTKGNKKVSDISDELDKINEELDLESKNKYERSEGVDNDIATTEEAKFNTEKENRYKEQQARINENITPLSTLIDNINTIISEAKKVGIDENSRTMLNGVISQISEISERAEFAMDTMMEDAGIQDFNLSRINTVELSEISDQPTISKPVFEDVNGQPNVESYLLDKFKELMTIIGNGINEKQDPLGLRTSLNQLTGMIEASKEAYISSNAINDMAPEHYSEDEILKNEEQKNAILRFIEDNEEKIKSFEDAISELMGDKDMYAKNYRKNVMKANFLLFRNLFQQKSAVLFGTKSDTVVQTINKIEELLSDKDNGNNMFEDDKIDDGKLIEIEKHIASLWQIFYESKDSMFTSRIDYGDGRKSTAIEWIVANFDFGPYELAELTGVNETTYNNTEDFIEPIQLFSVQNGKNNHIDFQAEPWSVRKKANSRPEKTSNYEVFIAQNLFASIMANMGESLNNMHRLYNMMESGTNYKTNTSGNVSSLEQMSMEIMCAQMMCAASSSGNYVKKILDIYKKQTAQRYKEKEDLYKKTIDIAPAEYINGFINFTGFGGSGKTNNSLNKILKLYALSKGKSKLNVSVMSYNDSTTSQAENAIDKNIATVKSSRAFSDSSNIGKIDYKVDVIIVDEASILNKSQLDLLTFGAKNSGALILALSDNTQISENIHGFNATHYYGMTLNPLMMVYRTNVPQIIQISDYFRTKVVHGGKDIKLPKLYSQIEDGKLYGGKYYRSQSELMVDFKNRVKNGANAILLVEDKNAYDKVVQNNPEIAGKVFIVGVKMEDADISIQGRQAEEVFIDYDLTTKIGNIGYTAVSRARTFVGFVNTAGQNAENISDVYWNTTPFELTTAQKEVKQKEILEWNKKTHNLNVSNTQKYPSAKPATTPNTSSNKTQQSTITTTTSEPKKESIKIEPTLVVGGQHIEYGTTYIDDKGQAHNIEDVGLKNGTEPFVKIDGDTEFKKLNDVKNGLIDDKVHKEDIVDDNTEIITSEEITQYKIDRSKMAYATNYGVNFVSDFTTDMSKEFSEAIRAIKNDNVTIGVFRSTPIKAITKHVDDNGHVIAESEKVFAEMRPEVIDSIINRIQNGKYKLRNGRTIDFTQINDYDENILRETLKYFAVFGTTNENDSMYNRIIADPTSFQIDETSSKIINGKRISTPMGDYSDVETLRELIDKLESKGLKTALIWESGLGGQVYLRVSANDGSITKIRLTAFTVAEHIARTGNDPFVHGDYNIFDNAINSINSAIENISDKSDKMHAAIIALVKTDLYQYLKKNDSTFGIVDGFVNDLTFTNIKNTDDTSDPYLKTSVDDIIEAIDVAKKEYMMNVDLNQEIFGNTFLRLNTDLSKANPGTLDAVRNNGKFNIDIFAPRIFFAFNEINPNSNSEDMDINAKIRANIEDGFFAEEEVVTLADKTKTVKESVDLMTRLWGENNINSSLVLHEGPIKTNEYYVEGEKVITRVTGLVGQGKLYLSTLDGKIKETTPKHEFTHWVMRYNIPKSTYNQLIDQARSMYSMEKGIPKSEVSEVMANEYISVLFGKTGHTQMKRETWYAKFPLLANFIESLRLVFSKLGIYKYKIKDLMYAMDSGYFANATVGEDNYMGELYEEDPEVGNVDEPLKSKKRRLIDVFGGNKQALDKAVKVIGREINKQSLLNPYSKSELSVVDASNMVFSTIVEIPEDTMLESIGVTVGEAYNDPDKYMDAILKSLSLKREDSGSRDYINYVYYILGFKDNRQELVNGILSGSIELKQAETQISLNTTTINQKDRINAITKWHMSFIPIQHESGSLVKTGTFVNPDLVDDMISNIIEKDGTKFEVIDTLTKLRDEANKMPGESVKKLHILSFVKYMQAMIDKANLLKESNNLAYNEIMNFINGYISNKGSQATKNIEAANIVYDKDGKVVKLTVNKKNINTYTQFKTRMKESVHNKVFTDNGVRQGLQKYLFRNFNFDPKVGIIDKATKEPFIKFTLDNNGNITEMDINKKIAPAIFTNLKKEFGLRDITDSMFKNIIDREFVRDVSGVNYATELKENYQERLEYTTASYMGYNMASLMTLAYQGAVYGKVVASIRNTMRTKLNEGKFSESSVFEYANSIVYNAPKKDTVNYDDLPKVISEVNKVTNEITGKLLQNEIADLNKILNDYYKKYSFSIDSNVPGPSDVIPLFELFAAIKALNNESNRNKTIANPDKSRRQTNNPVSPIDTVTHEQFKKIPNEITEESILYRNGKVHSAFTDPATMWELNEFMGAETGFIGKNELVSDDRVLIDIQEHRKSFEKNKIRIPVIPFGASGRPYYLTIKMNSTRNMTIEYAKLISNGLNRSQKAFELAKGKYLNAFSTFSMQYQNDQRITGLMARLELARNLSPVKFCKQFIDIQKEMEVIAESEPKVYFDYYSTILGSEMKQTRDYSEGGVLFYKQDGDNFLSSDQMNTTDVYIPIKRLSPGNAMKFGHILDDAGNQATFKVKDPETGKLLDPINAYSTRLWNSDFYNTPEVQKIINSNVILEEDAKRVMALVNKNMEYDMRNFGNKVARIWEHVKDNKDFKLFDDEKTGLLSKEKGLYDFFMSSLLYGEDFNSTAVGSHFDFKDKEDNIKRLKQWLTGCTYANSIVPNNGLANNFDMVYVSSEFGLADFGNGVKDIVNLVDGGGIFNSLANRLYQNNLGKNYSMFSGKMAKDLAIRYDPTTSEQVSNKESMHEPTDLMLEMNPDFMKMQVIMLANTNIVDKDDKKINLGMKYKDLWEQNLPHSKIVDLLYNDYINAKVKGPLTLKLGSESVSKITPSKINVGTINDLYNKVVSGEQLITKTHRIADLGFIYNPEINTNEDTGAMKVIQQESILPMVSDEYSQQINKVLANMNDYALDGFQKDYGIDLRDFINTVPSEDTIKKMINIMRENAVRGVEDKESFGTLIDLMRTSSMNIAPVFETIFQSYVNVHANKYGHRKKISGDRNMKMFGHGFKMIEKDGIRYNIAEYVEMFNNGNRLTDEQLKSLNAEPIRYMQIAQDNSVIREEAIGNFKYFDFFCLRSGEQPVHLYSIWKKNKQGQLNRIDLRNGLEKFVLDVAGNKVSYDFSKDETGTMHFYEDGNEVSIDRYASSYYSYMLQNNEIYDFNKSVLLRTNDFGAHFSDKLNILFGKNILNFQSSRIPFTVHSYFTLSTLVGFTNNKVKNVDGSEKYENSNLMFRNARGNARDGADFDGDASTDIWRSIIKYVDPAMKNIIRYSAESSENMQTRSFKAESNTLFDLHEKIMNDPRSYPYSFRLTSTKGFKAIKAEKVSPRKSIEGVQLIPVQERTNPNEYYKSEDLNSSDKDLIGIMAQNISILCELVQLPLNMRNDIIYTLNLPDSYEKQLAMIQLFDSAMQATLDGEKDSINGPFGITKELAGIYSIYLMETKIPLFMLPIGKEYNMENDQEVVFDENTIYEFFNQPVITRLRNRTFESRKMLESSFSHSLIFDVSREIDNTIDIADLKESDLSSIGLKNVQLDVYDQKLYNLVSEVADNEKSTPAQKTIAKKVLRVMRDVHVLNEIQNRLPAIEMFRTFGLLTALRKDVWAKTTNIKDHVHRIELAFGADIDEISKIFFDKSGRIRPDNEIEEAIKAKTNSVSDYYKKHSGEFYITDDGSYLLKQKGTRVNTEEYLDFIDTIYSEVNYLQYLRHIPSLLSYLGNLIMDYNVMRNTSQMFSQKFDEVKNAHLANIRSNYWNFVNDEVEFRDEFNKYMIESAIGGLYEGIPININTWDDGDEDYAISTNYSGIDLGKASGRNRFNLQMVELIRSLVDLAEVARVDKEKAKNILRVMISANKWDKKFTEENINTLVDKIPYMNFIKNIELFGAGVGKSVRYKSFEFGKYDSGELINQRNELSLFPTEIHEYISIFNAMKFGYQTKKTFFQVTGPALYSKIDAYLSENMDKIFDGKQKFLDSLYSQGKCLPYGTELAKQGVTLNDHVKQQHITPGGKEWSGYGTTKVHAHRVFVTENGITTTKDKIKFNKFPSVGGNYSSVLSSDIDTHTDMMVVKSLSAEDLGKFLKNGYVTVPNLENNYPAYVVDDDKKATKVVYLISDEMAYAEHVGDMITFKKIKGETKETLAGDIAKTVIVTDLTNANRILMEKRTEKLSDPNSTAYENIAFYDPNVSEASIIKEYGNDYILVREGIYEQAGIDTKSGKYVPSGTKNGFQFKQNTIELKINYSHKMKIIRPIDVNAYDPKYKKELETQQQKKDDRIKMAIETTKTQMLEARDAGKRILLPNYGNRGLGFALAGNDHYRPMYDEFSEWLYENFAYYNIGMKNKDDQKVLSYTNDPVTIAVNTVLEGIANDTVVKPILDFLKSESLTRIAGKGKNSGIFMNAFNEYVETIKEDNPGADNSSVIAQAKAYILYQIQKNKTC